MSTFFIRRREIHPRTKRLHVKGLYCKRPIQCLASSKILTPPPPTPSLPGECVPPAFGAGGGHTRWVDRRWGVKSSEDARHCSVLYICKHLVYLHDRLLCGLLCAILLYCGCSKCRGNVFYRVQSSVKRWNKLYYPAQYTKEKICLARRVRTLKTPFV
jgi:hypothetical protein